MTCGAGIGLVDANSTVRFIVTGDAVGGCYNDAGVVVRLKVGVEVACVVGVAAVAISRSIDCGAVALRAWAQDAAVICVMAGTAKTVV